MTNLITANLRSLESFGQSETGARLRRNAPTMLAFLLALVLAWQAAAFIWRLVPTDNHAFIPPVTRTAIAAPNDQQTTAAAISAAPIISAHLFGVALAGDEPQGVIEDTLDAPQTNLPLVLRGTLAAAGDEALAIIADGGTEKVYRLKDTIRRGVTLHSVQRQQVILNRNGTLEALKLPQQTAQSAPQRANNTDASRVANSRSVTDVLTQNASSLSEIIRPAPYYVGGQQRGYRLYPGKNRQQFASLGLRPGDIVTEINGTAMTNAQQGAAVFQSLGDQQSVNVTIQRGGQPINLTLNTQQLDMNNQASQ